MLKEAASFTQKNLYWIILFLVLFSFFCITPVSGDDYTFISFNRSMVGVQGTVGAFTYLFNNVNGRIVGNMLSFLLSSNVVLSSLVRAIIALIIIYSATRLLRLRSAAVRNLVTFILLFIPVGIFRQTYAWRAGFFNYVAPLASMALTGWLIYFYLKTKKLHNKVFILGGIFIMGTISSLFVENITLGWIFTLGTLLLIALFKERRLIFPVLSALAGSITGVVVMFSSPVYKSVASGNDGYRSVGTDSTSTLHTIRDNMIPYVENLLLGHVILAIALSILCILIIVFVNNHSRTKDVKLKLFCRIAVGILIFCPLYYIAADNFTNMKMLPSVAYNLYVLFTFIITVIHIMTIFSVVGLFVKDKYTKILTCSLLAGAVIYTVSLLPVTPFGGRNFYISYVFLGMVVVSLLLYVSKGKIPQHEVWLKRVTGYALITGCLLTFSIYGTIFAYQIKNKTSAEAQLESSESVIVLKKYPFTKFIHDPHNELKAIKYYSKQHCIYITCISNTDAYVEYR